MALPSNAQIAVLRIRVRFISFLQETQAGRACLNSLFNGGEYNAKLCGRVQFECGPRILRVFTGGMSLSTLSNAPLPGFALRCRILRADARMFSSSEVNAFGPRTPSPEFKTSSAKT